MKILLILLLFFPFASAAQQTGLYVAAKAGLNIREKPDFSAKPLDRIPYGTRITLTGTEEQAKRVSTEGFLGYWKKVTYNQKTGYVIDAFLLPAPPPAATIKTLKEYFGQLSPAFGEKLVVKKTITTNPEEGGAELSKQLYKNGAEWHEYLGYEYNSMTYFVPWFTMQQAFLLVRLIPEFAEYISEKDEYVTSGKKVKKKEREYQYSIEKEVFGDTPWIHKIKIGFEDGAVYNFEMYQIDDQVVIFYGAGV